MIMDVFGEDTIDTYAKLPELTNKGWKNMGLDSRFRKG